MRLKSDQRTSMVLKKEIDPDIFLKIKKAKRFLVRTALK